MSPPSETTLRLWISRTRGTDIAAASARSRSAASSARRLDVDDDVAAGQRVLELRLDPVGDRVALTDGRAGRDGDHDVGERAPRRLAQAQPGERDRRLDARDRGTRRRLGLRRRAIHQHVDVPPDQPAGGEEHERGDEERCDRVALRIAGRRGDETAEHRERPGEVAAEVDRVRAQRLAAVAARRAERDDRAGEVDREHDRHDDEEPPRRVDLGLVAPVSRVDRERRDGDADEREHGRLRQRGEMLGLPVPVLVPLVGGPAGDADREERQQRGDEVRPGVQRLRDEPQAAADETGAELERGEHRRRADRDERGSALRRHAAK